MDLGSQSGFVHQGTWGEAAGGGNLELLVPRSYGDVSHVFQARSATATSWHVSGRTRITRGPIGQVRSASLFEASPARQGRRLYAAVRVFDGPDSSGRGHEEVRLVSRGGPPNWSWYTKGIGLGGESAAANCAAIETRLSPGGPVMDIVMAAADGGVLHLRAPYDGEVDQFGRPVWRQSEPLLSQLAVEAVSLLHRPGTTFLELLVRDSHGVFHYLMGDVVREDVFWREPLRLPSLREGISGADAHGIFALTYTSDVFPGSQDPEVGLWMVTPYTVNGRSGGLAAITAPVQGSRVAWGGWQRFDGPTDDLRWSFYTGGQSAPRQIREVSLQPVRTGPGKPMHLTHELCLRFTDVNSYETRDTTFEAVIVNSQRYWAARPRGPDNLQIEAHYWWSPASTAIAL